MQTSGHEILITRTKCPSFRKVDFLHMSLKKLTEPGYKVPMNEFLRSLDPSALKNFVIVDVQKEYEAATKLHYDKDVLSHVLNK